MTTNPVDIVRDAFRNCDTCARPGTPGGVCTLTGMDLDTCLGNPSRPFWRPKKKSCSRHREKDTRRPTMTQIELTPKQIKEIDEIMLDKNANDNTLNIALTYHSNRQTSIRKKEKAWWDDMMQTYDLDPARKWVVDFKSPVIHIREADDEKE